MNKTYLCIDLKTFFASVECVERGLNPFCTNLVVADKTRGEGTIALAITPYMKEQGIKNRCRLYEIPKHITYIKAMPRMQLYIDYSAKVYETYLNYIAPEDIHPYSIDEMFLDITPYLSLYKMSKYELAKLLLNQIYKNTGLFACAGIGDNLYLAKIALDMVAKKNPDGIGYLSIQDYQKKFLDYTPLSDFWQISTGITNRLAKRNIFTFRDLLASPEDEIYKEFGVNAELLLDHARGYENVEISDIQKYKSKAKSLSNSQILFRDYTPSEAKVILTEMVDLMALKLTNNNLITKRIALQIGYSNYQNQSNGQFSLTTHTSLFSELKLAFINLYNKLIKHDLLVRKIGISVSELKNTIYQEYNLFLNAADIQKEQNLQKTINMIKTKYGKNSILKGINYLKEATTRERNKLIGGHNSGQND